MLLMLMPLADSLGIIVQIVMCLVTILLALYTMFRTEHREDESKTSERSKNFTTDMARMEIKLDTTLERLQELIDSQKANDIKLTEYGLELTSMKEQLHALEIRLEDVKAMIRNDDLDSMEKRINAIAHKINGISEGEINEG